MAPNDVIIPKRMRTLPKDHRGYPIPFIVLRDRNKKPHFTINDERKSRECIRTKRCAICGNDLERTGPDRGFWCVGGPACFLNPMGAFIDPPLHRECAEYALQVCPFLANPSYARRIDGATLKEGQASKGILVRTDPNVKPEQPPLFGLANTLLIEIIPGTNGLYRPIGGWATLPTFWRRGERVPPEVALPILVADERIMAEDARDWCRRAFAQMNG